MAGFLLDTNVVSELRKRQRADPGVTAWILGQPDEELFLSVATFGEIRKGIERLRPRDAKQATGLETWAEALESRYQNRLFDVSLKIFKHSRPTGRIGLRQKWAGVEFEFLPLGRVLCQTKHQPAAT